MSKMKKNIKRTIITSLSLILILGCAFAAFHMISTKQVKAVYEAQLTEANNTIMSNTKDVYLASRDIKYGEVIAAEDVTVQSAIVALDGNMFFAAEDIGSVALIDIPLGTIVTSNMFIEKDCDNSLRETEFDVFVLNSNLTDGDFVDVRIRYQNGEDYVVFSKKCVKNLSLRNAVCYMDITEEETQLISSAIVDAGIYKAVLYTTTYLEPSIQEPSVVTYQPSADVLSIIQNNPNIVAISTENLSANARTEMEERLDAYERALNGGSGGEIFNVTNTPEIDNAGNLQDGYVDTTEEETE